MSNATENSTPGRNAVNASTGDQLSPIQALIAGAQAPVKSGFLNKESQVEPLLFHFLWHVETYGFLCQFNICLEIVRFSDIRVLVNKVLFLLDSYTN